ncbi:S1C family serine protease [Halalkalirubrum salinum]|uniref:S1C family serine protease n=1 Tax=Halalkalirubrum salinum TaxID=2563889 RepID=UPI0010FB5E75|nr:trypsin-like peptidase domain-containing protein [Halalkalirubrum salinum]
MEPTRRGVLSIAASAIFAGCAAPITTRESADTTQSTSSSPTVAVENASIGIDSGGYADLYEATVPAVAQIETTDRTGRGQGSGFLIDPADVDGADDRLLVTNDHVIPEDADINVTFHEGAWYEGTLVGRDPYSDLAVVRIDSVPDDAVSLSLVDRVPPIGAAVIAIGAPLDLPETITQGVISGRNRSLPGPLGYSIADTVQTDAALNPGNSGGPLLTTDGRVAGVVSATSGENIGFAISAALARRVLPALATDGDYDHSQLGIRSVPVDPPVAELNELPDTRGVMVVEVPDDGPSAGILQGAPESDTIDGTEYPIGGDVIRQLDDVPIVDQSSLSRYLALETSPGDRVDVAVRRDGEEVVETVTLGRRPDP